MHVRVWQASLRKEILGTQRVSPCLRKVLSKWTHASTASADLLHSHIHIGWSSSPPEMVPTAWSTTVRWLSITPLGTPVVPLV
jgi:hypothetical protein